MRKFIPVLFVAAVMLSAPRAEASDIPLAGITVLLEEATDVSTYTREEINIIEKLTEAEATDQSIEAKMNIASVIINRVDHEDFPDTVEEVVFQPTQFSPIYDGRYYELTTTEETIDAVARVLRDGVTTEALYFCNMRYVESTRIRNWFYSLHYIFKDSSGHSFYK